MAEANPAVVALQAQYLASRQEASSCRTTAAQYESRASAADDVATALATAITSLGGAAPEFPPAPDPDEEDYPSTPPPPTDTPPLPEEGS